MKQEVASHFFICLFPSPIHNPGEGDLQVILFEVSSTLAYSLAYTFTWAFLQEKLGLWATLK